MKNLNKLSYILLVAFAFNILFLAAPARKTNAEVLNITNNLNIEKDIESASSYLKDNMADPWVQMSLNKLDIKGKEDFIEKWFDELDKKPIRSIERSELIRRIMKHYHLISLGTADLYVSELITRIVGLTASGYSPYDFKGYNLVEEVFNGDIEKFQFNEIVYGLILYNYANLQENYKITEEKLVNEILKKRISYEMDGKKLEGWNWFGNQVDPDITAIVISALSPYYNGKKIKGIDTAKVKEVVDLAVKTLSIMQGENGSILDNYGPSIETDAFVILALVSVGIDPQGGLFTKAKGDLVSSLLSFKEGNGIFNSDKVSTEQALRVLISLREFKKAGIYNYYSSNIDAKDLPIYGMKNEEIKESNVKPEKVLPETGSHININSLITIAIVSIALGLVVLTRKK